MILLEEFDALAAPIEGVHLIEASAGTGKTHTISSLFLRLLLDKRLTVREILVVTFTNAATGELKDRIRDRILQAMEACSTDHGNDLFLEALIRGQDDGEELLWRLKQAIREFDEAAIFTIHGFCQRVLHESAYETGSLFDTQLIIDEEPLREEVVNDFWRRQFYGAPPELISHALTRDVTPQSLLGFLRKALVHPDLKIEPALLQAGLPSLQPLRREFGRLKSAWGRYRDAVREKLMNPALKGNAYGTIAARADGPSSRDMVVSGLMQAVDAFLSSEYAQFPLFKGLGKLTTRTIRESVKKGHAAPSHEIFDMCERFLEEACALEEEMNRHLILLKGEMVQYCRRELDLRKQHGNLRSFDDLLKDMRSALSDPRKVQFMKAVQTGYKAALIDEFQDTDPIQYEIFRTLFGDKGSLLYMIGDPKQAIYGFRGADLFTYMEAARHLKQRFTLRVNWRSQPDLLAAVNTVFTNRDHPFLFKEIPYVEAEPVDRTDPAELKIAEGSQAPLQIWFLDATNETDPGKPIIKTRARQLISEAISAEISRLIGLGRQGKAFIEDDPLNEKHMAVLVRRNRDARLIQESLGMQGIPSVLYSADNLFDTQEAWETELLLNALVKPDSGTLLRAALATQMMGVTGERLDSLAQDETAWESIVSRFMAYRELWGEKGFLPMFRHLMARERIRVRLLAFPDGERRLTNLLHLSEVLHREATNRGLGLHALLKWLSRQRDPSSQRLEEHQLRLESDELAVKIVTIHKSKGLEYPVVFCPFSWEGSNLKGDELLYHDEEDNHRLTMDLGSEGMEQKRPVAEMELLAEDLRLLYVALTRAKNRCYLVWGRISGAETSPLAFLLHGPSPAEETKMVEATRSRFTALGRDDLLRELDALIRRGGDTIHLSSSFTGQEEIPSLPIEPAQALICRGFSGNIARDWGVSSFSSLVSRPGVIAELPDYDALSLSPEEADEAVEPPHEAEPARPIYSFPRGAKAGTFLHDLLEHLDFTRIQDPGLKEQVKEKLAQYGFDPLWVGTVCEMVRNVLNTSLDNKMPDLSLKNIRQKDRLNELEFHLPIKKTSPSLLREIFRANPHCERMQDFPELLGGLHFAPARGFMTGFMDLVFHWQGRFYLVDWKSNFLGNSQQDYGQDSLTHTMHREFYILQYHIYTLALDQYLRLRLPGYRYEEHFGGIYYIFLRGVEPGLGPAYGIYRDLPPAKLIQGLGENLIDPE